MVIFVLIVVQTLSSKVSNENRQIYTAWLMLIKYLTSDIAGKDITLILAIYLP